MTVQVGNLSLFAAIPYILMITLKMFIEDKLYS
jgi:hypothetical protein